LGAYGPQEIFNKRVLAMKIRGIRTRIKWRGIREVAQSEKKSNMVWIWSFDL